MPISSGCWRDERCRYHRDRPHGIVAVPDLEHVPGFTEVAMHVAKGDRPPQSWRFGGTGQRADLSAAAFQPHPRQERALACRSDQADEPLCDTSLTAMQHADDDLLPDVTALRQADRP